MEIMPLINGLIIYYMVCSDFCVDSMMLQQVHIRQLSYTKNKTSLGCYCLPVYLFYTLA